MTHAPKLSVISYRAAPAGSGTLLGHVTLQLPNGTTLECALRRQGDVRQLVIPVDRELQRDGSTKWTPQLAFDSSGAYEAFNAYALVLLDAYLANLERTASHE